MDIAPGNVHILDGNAANLAEECHQYEQAIAAHGGIELFLCGASRAAAHADADTCTQALALTDTSPSTVCAQHCMRPSHAAEPGSSLRSHTRVKTLAYDTILANGAALQCTRA